MSRFWQPLVPDRVPGAPDRRDVLTVGKHRILLRRDSDAGKVRRNPGEIRDLDTAQVIEIPLIIGVVPDTERRLTDLPGNGSKVRQKSLPLRRDSGARLARVALGNSGQEKNASDFKSHDGRTSSERFFHLDGL